MKKCVSIILILLVSLLMSNVCNAALATSGSVYLNAETGSYVGGAIGAKEVLWTHGMEGIFYVSQNYDKGVSVLFEDGRHWSFDFAAPTFDPKTNTNDGNQLAIGFYDHATRFPFNSPTKPGLSFTGNGCGNNTLGGWFKVLDVAYNTNGDILRFAVDFRQFDESPAMTGPSTYGSLRINSDIPINRLSLNSNPSTVPIPSAALLFISGLLLIMRKSKRR